MKVIILTSSVFGTAAHHLPHLIESKACEIAMVVLNEDKIRNKKNHFKRKFSKIRKIGILGAINGIRMRKWFNEDIGKYLEIENLEKTCIENKIPFYRTSSINTNETIQLFTKADADLGVSLGNGYISQKIFSIPRFGMINIHHEILPEYQNAQSIIWQIYNMSSNTGYTIHKIDKSIDTGDILYQEIVAIEFLDTLPETVAKTGSLLLKASSRGLVKVLENFSQLNQNAKSQGKGNSYTTPSLWQYLRILKNFRKLKATFSEKNEALV